MPTPLATVLLVYGAILLPISLTAAFIFATLGVLVELGLFIGDGFGAPGP